MGYKILLSGEMPVGLAATCNGNTLESDIRMKVVEARISEMKRKRFGRKRSPEMQQLIDVIAALKPGQAKALVPEGKETVKNLHQRILNAARIAGKKVRIVAEAQRVLFALRSAGRSGSTPSRSRAAARKSKVQAKVLELGKRGKSDISAQDVIDALTADGQDLGVARPGTMVGAVLRSMPEFQRIGPNKFRYIG
jgi:hypothetical protein